MDVVPLVEGAFVSRLSFLFFGISAEQAQDRYSEAAEIVLQAMETATLNHDGRYFKLDNVPISLSPFQRPHPPLWYGTMRPETALLAAEKNINIACIGRSVAIRIGPKLLLFLSSREPIGVAAVDDAPTRVAGNPLPRITHADWAIPVET